MKCTDCGNKLKGATADATEVLHASAPYLLCAGSWHPERWQLDELDHFAASLRQVKAERLLEVPALVTFHAIREGVTRRIFEGSLATVEDLELYVAQLRRAYAHARASSRAGAAAFFLFVEAHLEQARCDAAMRRAS